MIDFANEEYSPAVLLEDIVKERNRADELLLEAHDTVDALARGLKIFDCKKEQVSRCVVISFLFS
jgi:hypothetical protein